MSTKQWNERLAKASEFLKEGKTIWYQREGFNDPKYRDKEPKWHVFKDREPSAEHKGNYTWTSKCGYRKDFSETHLEEHPRLNLSKTPPKKINQCGYCVKQLEKEKKSNAAQD